jgi:hypothetical protein
MTNHNLIRLFHLLIQLVFREKFNPMRNNEKLLELDRLNVDNKKLDYPVNMAEAIRFGAPTCDASAHLNYVTTTGIDVWNIDPEHVIDVIPDFIKTDIEDQWNQARQLEDAMVAEIFDTSVCACCGHRCPHSDIQIGLTPLIQTYWKFLFHVRRKN